MWNAKRLLMVKKMDRRVDGLEDDGDLGMHLPKKEKEKNHIRRVLFNLWVVIMRAAGKVALK